MRLAIVALRDICANYYHPPMFVQNIGAAVRSFGDACQKEADSDLWRHPEHFELWHMGWWDDQESIFITEGEEDIDDDGKTYYFHIKQIAVGLNYKR